MDYPTITRSQFQTLWLARGWTFRGAYLYEPQHAQKGTVFVYVQLSENLTKFVRLFPPKEK